MKNHYLKKMTLESPNYGKCYWCRLNVQHRYIKLVTREARKNYLLSEQNYHTKKSSGKFISLKIW